MSASHKNHRRNHVGLSKCAQEFVFCPHVLNVRRLPRKLQGHVLPFAMRSDCPGQAYLSKAATPNLPQHLVLHRWSGHAKDVQPGVEAQTSNAAQTTPGTLEPRDYCR